MRLYAMCTGCGRAIGSAVGICHACRRAPQASVKAKKEAKNNKARKPRREHD